jgi:hypothetical protein
MGFMSSLPQLAWEKGFDDDVVVDRPFGRLGIGVYGLHVQ